MPIQQGYASMISNTATYITFTWTVRSLRCCHRDDFEPVASSIRTCLLFYLLVPASIAAVIALYRYTAYRKTECFCCEVEGSHSISQLRPELCRALMCTLTSVLLLLTMPPNKNSLCSWSDSQVSERHIMSRRNSQQQNHRPCPACTYQGSA